MSDTTPTQQQQAERQTYTIKPLEWTDESDKTVVGSEFWSANCDEYNVYKTRDGNFRWRHDGPSQTAESIAAGKAAAESHYRKRLMACLSPATPEAADPAPAAPAPQQLDAAKPSAAPANTARTAQDVVANAIQTVDTALNECDPHYGTPGWYVHRLTRVRDVLAGCDSSAAPASEGGDVVELREPCEKCYGSGANRNHGDGVSSEYCNECEGRGYHVVDPPLPTRWLPTASNINALPDGLRHFVHDLEARADPAGEVAELTLLRDQSTQITSRFAALTTEVDRLRAIAEAQSEVVSELEFCGDPEEWKRARWDEAIQRSISLDSELAALASAASPATKGGES